MNKELEAKTNLSHYRIVSKIGAGGMGEVYLAQDTKLDRKVALKILPTEVAADRNRMNRFVQEAKAASALNHPNILTIYEIEQSESVNFIAMEFIEGATLRDRMRNESMKVGEVLDVAAQIASALSAAHAAGIVHRDVKPENVMLRRDGIVKVLDFGLAKLSAPPAVRGPRQGSPAGVDVAGGFNADTEAPTKTLFKTDEGVVMGTATYMSPEQARGLQVEARTDIWSLGVVLYELVAGCLPFEGSTSSEVLASILNEKEAPPLARFARDVPAELERIVEKALRKDREERYQSAKDLLLDLRRLKHKLEVDAEIERTVPPELRGATSEAKAPGGQEAALTAQASVAPTAAVESARTASGGEYFVTEIKKHKRGVALSLVALVLALAGIVYSVYFARLAGPIDSIAVLPLSNASNDPNTEYLSDGITESIINSLSQLPNLKVMSRNSVFHYKGKDMAAQAVAKELKVQAVLTGRVTQRGESLSIGVELINAQDNSQIWGQQYNRKLADVFAVQEEMAKEISEKLRLKLTGAERQQLAKRPTENLKAFQYYMQGRSYTQRRTRADLLTAIRYCERAIAEDGNYALAYAGLAEAYVLLGARGYIAPIEGRRKAEEAAGRALALDENLAEAHAAFGQAYVTFAPSNFSLGDRELRRAIELSPSTALAHFYLGLSLVRQGRLDESLVEYLKARELDPLSSIVARQVALAYHLKRDHVRALELLRQASELGPALSATWEIGAYIQNRSFDEALAELERAKRERKSDPILIYSTGMVYAAQGKRPEALQIIKELEEMSGANLSQAHWIAKIYATLQEKEMTFSWLERGLAAGAISLFYKDEPVWDTIRSDLRFADLLRRMGIPS